MRERDIEAYLVKEVKARGGEVRKLRWIGRRGAPDRLVLLPNCAPLMLELKAPGRKVTAQQMVEIMRLNDLNMTAGWADSLEAIDVWLDALLPAECQR